jgi:hypothetical protein
LLQALASVTRNIREGALLFQKNSLAHQSAHNRDNFILRKIKCISPVVELIYRTIFTNLGALVMTFLG